jgi:hypothetical protein
MKIIKNNLEDLLQKKRNFKAENFFLGFGSAYAEVL